MADVFFIQCVGYGVFRGGSRYHHRGYRWLYKSWAKATSQGEEKQSKTEGRNPAKQRKKIHRKNRENANKETQKKPTLTSPSPQFPLQIRKRKNPSSKPWPSSSPEQKENRRSRRTQTRTKSPSYKPPRDLQKQVSRSHFLFILVFNYANVEVCEGNLITFAQLLHAWNFFTRAV